LVTGGAGFVGGHLVDRLLGLEHQVLVMDNLFAGRREHVPRQAYFEEIDLGSADESRIFALVREFCPDYVVHLAAIHHIPYCLAHPGEVFASNVRSTDVVVRALEGLPTRKVVATSTGDVYPVTDAEHPETERPAPSNAYGLSKLLMEEIVACACRVNANLSGIILRLFNVYGTRETNSHVIPRIIELLHNRDLTEIRMGYLGGTRDFVHVFDVVSAICAALFRSSGKFDTFNVGTGIPTPIRVVLDCLMQAADDHRPVIEDEARFRSFDRKSLTANIAKIRGELGWQPAISVQEGLVPLLHEHDVAVSAAAAAALRRDV